MICHGDAAILARENRYSGAVMRLKWLAFALACVAPVVAVQASDAPTGLFVDDRSTTVQAAGKLEGAARADALRLARIPSATWLAHGTPEIVEAIARDVTERAAAASQMPVLVAYNIPYRDCALYSAGGAADGAAYLAWIAGLARGVGNRPAIIVLEPDGLGVIPWHRNLAGELEGCRPEGQDEAAAVRRYEQLRGAVAILGALPRARVYLDGTGSSWLAPGEIASRLVRADVGKVAGFFLNVSNFESDARVVPYARWVSDCIALVSRTGLDPRACPSQFSADPFEAPRNRQRIDAAYDRLFAEAGLGRAPEARAHALIDTSRNGQGSWKPPAARYRDAEVWCNPPGRGLGRRPTLITREAYVDGFLWIKVPGESDGECLRGTAGPMDPERGVKAPAAGQWFADQARELIELAQPPLKRE
ncbi:MAG: glycoside hydrolase family 6 [Blastomonas sp. CACIA14H2]|nr:MAG: glycoside hydrolase family 6 [Blastomonas sp. CACIA14H2]